MPNNNKIVFGDEVLMDLTQDSVTPQTLMAGETAHDRSGTPITGELDVGNFYSVNDSAETDIANDDYIPFYDTSATAKKKSLWSNIVAKIKTALGIASSGSTFLRKDGTWGNPIDTWIGTCTTAANEQHKVATVDNAFTLLAGVRIGIKFSYNNTFSSQTSTPITLNVNNTGDKNIYYNNNHSGAGNTGTNTKAYGVANRYNYYVYDGTYWVWDGCGTDDNSTYSITQYTSSPSSLADFVQNTAKGNLITTFKFKDSSNIFGFGANTWLRGYIQYQNSYGAEYGVGGNGFIYAVENACYRLFIDGKTADDLYFNKNVVKDTTYTFATGDSNGQIKVTPSGGSA